jgi:uncharacterized protein YPO0396
MKERMEVWKLRAEQLLDKNTRNKEIMLLSDLERRRAILTERIESLERALKSVGWKRRRGRGPCKAPYPDDVVNRLRMLAPDDRVQAIRDLAAQEGIHRKSVYRRLQKCVLWSNRRLVSQTTGAAE